MVGDVDVAIRDLNLLRWIVALGFRARVRLGASWLCSRCEGALAW